jgi:hypothetical protein
MAAKGAVRLDRYEAKKGGSGLISIKAAVEFENGFVFTAEDLASGEREIFTPVQFVTATITTNSLYLHASPEVTYLAGQTITDYSLAIGDVGRGILLRKGDIITVTNNMLTGTIAVGKYLIPANASYKLAIANDLTGGTVFAAKVIETTTIYGQAATVFEVIKN